MKLLFALLATLCLAHGGTSAYGQTGNGGKPFSLEEALTYALANQPAFKATRLADSLAELENQIALSAWRPSVGVTGTAQHYFKQPVSIIPDLQNPESGDTREVTFGTVNSSAVGANLRQLLYSPAVVRDLRLRQLRRDAARLHVEEASIDVKVRVSQAFYRALQTQEQARLAQADIVRLERSLREAKLRFDEGLNDKVDYKRATIALNSAWTNLGNFELATQARLQDLKALMGYPQGDSLSLSYDPDELAALVRNDSTIQLDVQQRVELRRLQVEGGIQDQSTRYLRQAWYPTVSVGAQGNVLWFANELDELYGNPLPNALGMLNVDFPIYDGGRRLRQVERSRVLQSQLSLNLRALREELTRGFSESGQDYQQVRNRYLVAIENLALAQEIYDVVDLQYREGLSTYLEVVVAESDLQEARFAILNNLIDASIARIEVRRAAGTL